MSYYSVRALLGHCSGRALYGSLQCEGGHQLYESLQCQGTIWVTAV